MLEILGRACEILHASKDLFLVLFIVTASLVRMSLGDNSAIRSLAAVHKPSSHGVVDKRKTQRPVGKQARCVVLLGLLTRRGMTATFSGMHHGAFEVLSSGDS